MVAEQEKLCEQCQEKKPLSAFHRRKNKTDGRMRICAACFTMNNRRRDEELLQQWRGLEQERREREHLEWEREKEAKRQEALAWFETQPDKVCVTCHEKKKAIEFAYHFSSNFFSTTLYTRCKECHEAYRARIKDKRIPPCPVFQRTIDWRGFFPNSLRGQDTPFHYCRRQDTTEIYICCNTCIEQFLALPESHQRAAIRVRCNHAMPTPQFIYAECDPGSMTPRYIGRTGNLKARHTQHINDIKPGLTSYGTLGEYYGRSNWMYDLIMSRQEPKMRMLMQVEIAPQVVEYERRYILHGLQQRWPLTNHETLQDDLVESVQSSQADFLHAPFEDLMKLGFFSPDGLPAFIRNFYRH